MAGHHDNVSYLVFRPGKNSYMKRDGVFIFIRIKKGEGTVKGGRCQTKTMMSTKAIDRLKINTQHMPFRENTEEKIRGKDLEVVFDDVNEYNEESV